MEEFIDYILYLVLIVIIAFTGMLIFFLIKDPAMAYRLLALFLSMLAGGIGLVIRKSYRKKRLGKYYELSREIPQIQKDIRRSTKRLERHSRKMMKEQFPKIRKLCSQAQQRLKNVAEIERTLRSFEKKQPSNSSLTSNLSEKERRKLYASKERYLHNIQRIKESKRLNLQQVQEILRILHELNSQILALKFSEETPGLQEDIGDTIGELLVEMQSLEELT